MRNANQLVIGAGEVGHALFQVLSCPMRDVEDPNPIGQYDVLHICFPWSDEFVAQIMRYVEIHSADLVIVHSTVPPGTCDPHDWVHSPVRGRHPDLVDGLYAFVKHCGGRRSPEAARILSNNGMGTASHPRAFDTEAGKVWELVQFGLQVLVEKEIHHWCEKNGADFDVVYTAMAHTYNDGFGRLGWGRFVRPVIEHMPGPIGGHCVRQNAWMTDHWIGDIVEFWGSPVMQEEGADD